jgi:hypothetical protein
MEATNGYTWGKRSFELRLVGTEDGRAIDWKAVILRNSALILVGVNTAVYQLLSSTYEGCVGSIEKQLKSHTA